MGLKYDGKSTLCVAWFIDLVRYLLSGSLRSWRPRSAGLVELCKVNLSVD